MKKASILFLLLGIFVIAIPAFAYNDICEMGEKALTMTTGQMDAFYKDRIKGWSVEGSGEVYDVVVKNKRRCIVIVNCGNNVFVSIEAGDYGLKIKQLNIGDRIEFSGQCSGLTRKYYQDSDKKHIEAFVYDASIHY